MDDGMETAVYSAAVVILITEILTKRFFLVPGDMDGVLDQLVHPLVLGGRDWDNRDAQHGFHRVYVNCTAIACQLVHHVEREHSGNIHFEQLHGEIQVPLNVCGIDDVDDAFRMVVQHKIARYQLFVGIGGH